MSFDSTSTKKNNKTSNPTPKNPLLRLLTRVGVFALRLACVQVEQALPPEAVAVGLTADEVAFLTGALSDISEVSTSPTPSPLTTPRDVDA